MPAARFVLALVALGSPFLVALNAAADETGMAGMHSWRVERGKTCLLDHFHSGAGEGSTKSVARKAAIVDWEGFTAFEYGTDWARFRNAASKGITYSKTVSGWRASIDARPCRRGVRRAKRK